MTYYSKLPDCKPVSVPLRAAIIPLGRTLLSGSSNLPGSLAGRAVPPPLFGLAPRGVFPASEITSAAVRSYRTFSPLPRRYAARRYIFCGTFRIRCRTPAVSRHAALWRPDFPPRQFDRERLPVRQLHDNCRISLNGVCTGTHVAHRTKSMILRLRCRYYSVYSIYHCALGRNSRWPSPEQGSGDALGESFEPVRF